MGVREDRRMKRPEEISVRVTARSRHAPMGRFGGGWQWAVGFQLGGGTLILRLLVFSVVIDWGKRSQIYKPPERRC